LLTILPAALSRYQATLAASDAMFQDQLALLRSQILTPPKYSGATAEASAASSRRDSSQFPFTVTSSIAGTTRTMTTFQNPLGVDRDDRQHRSASNVQSTADSRASTVRSTVSRSKPIGAVPSLAQTKAMFAQRKADQPELSYEAALAIVQERQKSGEDAHDFGLGSSQF
jgi:hypothetical protein